MKPWRARRILFWFIIIGLVITPLVTVIVLITPQLSSVRLFAAYGLRPFIKEKITFKKSLPTTFHNYKELSDFCATIPWNYSCDAYPGCTSCGSSGGGLAVDCAVNCKASCYSLDPNNCFNDACETISDCDGKKICIDKVTDNLDKQRGCGTVGYKGTNDCCPGLTKKCRYEVLDDGSCQLKNKFLGDTYLICMPCGNGVCEIYPTVGGKWYSENENLCSCPEDCNK